MTFIHFLSLSQVSAFLLGPLNVWTNWVNESTVVLSLKVEFIFLNAKYNVYPLYLLNNPNLKILCCRCLCSRANTWAHFVLILVLRFYNIHTLPEKPVRPDQKYQNTLTHFCLSVLFQKKLKAEAKKAIGQLQVRTLRQGDQVHLNISRVRM